MKAPPDEVKLSREEGQALIERLQANTLTGEDRGLLVKLIQLYFWFTFALRRPGAGRTPGSPARNGAGRVAGRIGFGRDRLNGLNGRISDPFRLFVSTAIRETP